MKARNTNIIKKKEKIFILNPNDLAGPIMTSNDLKIATPWVDNPGHYGHFGVKKWESDKIKLNGTAIKKKYFFCDFPKK